MVATSAFGVMLLGAGIGDIGPELGMLTCIIRNLATGIFVGAATGPLLLGQIIERAGFEASWAFTAGCLLAAAVVMVAVNRSAVAENPPP